MMMKELEMYVDVKGLNLNKGIYVHRRFQQVFDNDKAQNHCKFSLLKEIHGNTKIKQCHTLAKLSDT